jgi:hypothetical protein
MGWDQLRDCEEQRHLLEIGSGMIFYGVFWPRIGSEIGFSCLTVNRWWKVTKAGFRSGRIGTPENIMDGERKEETTALDGKGRRWGNEKSEGNWVGFGHMIGKCTRFNLSPYFLI